MTAALRPAASVARMAVPAEPGELRRLQTFLAAFWAANGLPARDAMRVELGLEEAFINIVTHGLGEGRPGAVVTVDLRLAGARLEVAVEDPGPAFDPLAAGPSHVDADASLESRLAGGLGVHLVRALLDDVRYERCGERNRLTMAADLAKGAA